MGWNDHMARLDLSRSHVTCRCGAKYSIYEDDGTPGCRDVETVICEFCGKELARHHGTCDGTLIDDKAVSKALKEARKKCDVAVQAYIQKNGYNWGTDEYAAILKEWHDTVEKAGYKL